MKRDRALSTAERNERRDMTGVSLDGDVYTGWFRALPFRSDPDRVSLEVLPGTFRTIRWDCARADAWNGSVHAALVYLHGCHVAARAERRERVARVKARIARRRTPALERDGKLVRS